ncbi:TRAP transporter small permease [Neobacillus rhizophilus]|uniref:TRAP transporter small permease n=1 Tax=Neobacillus rhizophilus TaxID=2833579 RepID=A0A942U3T0_9BACI|nr:TRAP transporter small permease [Neobacillus rhizophilus]MBS4212332.1 TRAP transporter small permease [Neobacillus rhizophilus]MBU8915764.1 TRAP transporter small permease [Bacillus sp. FJAT-29953]
MKALKRFCLLIDSLFEKVALGSLVAMIIIVTLQVFTRKLFNFVLFWSEEVTLLMLCWFSFMGIAIGVREKLHLAIESFTAKLPPAAINVIDKVVSLATMAFGYYLLKYGWDFTVLMSESTLPATKLSNAWEYGVMPITGFMMIIYAFLQLIGIDTRRHNVEGGGH